ncbi:hypothetical protein AB751O23_BJ_00040 [Chlamydiales bacterium SCGC AB-751-O23]|jgi:type II secretory pathway pseudopilin PulG|nr:hypothetical protein AB751O23_BJ_00040 [Chlamydiales bacterium SCGC AB-751-O23]
MKKKTYFLSLVEIIVVIILITTISSSISISTYKYLQTGKAFKTRQNAMQIESSLELQVERSAPLSLSLGSEDYQRINNWKELVSRTPFFEAKPSSFKDGWGNDFQVSFSENKQKFKITTEKYEQYKKKYGSLDLNEEDEEI